MIPSTFLSGWNQAWRCHMPSVASGIFVQSCSGSWVNRVVALVTLCHSSLVQREKSKDTLGVLISVCWHFCSLKWQARQAATSKSMPFLWGIPRWNRIPREIWKLAGQNGYSKYIALYNPWMSNFRSCQDSRKVDAETEDIGWSMTIRRWSKALVWQTEGWRSINSSISSTSSISWWCSCSMMVEMKICFCLFFHIMWLKQCHTPSPSHHHFYRWYVHHSQSWVAHGIVLPTLYEYRYTKYAPIKP